MARIDKKMMEFCKTAYSVLKNIESEHACHVKYREGDERYLEFFMEKKSWYYGSWALFEGHAFVATFDENFLKSLNEEKSE